MKWIRDNTGRFPHRPYYQDGEIDQECEAVVSEFLTRKYGSVHYPISTNDLTVLLEQKAGELDLYADLSSYGTDVEGVTEFYASKKPRVLISAELVDQPHRENRYRTTLTHELGHVHLHGFLLSGGQQRLFEMDAKNTNQCIRDKILGANQTDWMEWQAGYASGAILMPLSPLQELVRAFYETSHALAVETPSSPEGITLVRKVVDSFQVSQDAARVRLLQRKLLAEQKKTPYF